MYMKEGTVLLIGRPNVGKSTFVNNILGQKVAITSPKPQTTRFPIKAVYREDRGNIVFVDTPGIFGKAHDFMAKQINANTLHSINQSVDVVIYMIDHTRPRNFEESKVLGIVRKIEKPKILVFNKVDIKEPSYMPQYRFLEDEFEHVFSISAINKTHVGPLMNQIFEFLPEVKETGIEEKTEYPILNMDSFGFVAELIREKIFLKMGEELPYTSTVIVEEIKERSKTLTYIKAKILTTDLRYKKMIIGEGGRKIKEMGSMARKELELALDRQIYLDLTVEVDAHWQETYYSA